MEQVLQGIPNVVVYLYDILVVGKDEADHLKTLAKVLNRLEEHELRVKKNKCRFLKTTVEYQIARGYIP